MLELLDLALTHNLAPRMLNLGQIQLAHLRLRLEVRLEIVPHDA